MFIFLQYQNDIIIREGGTVTDYLGIEPTLRSSADEINEQLQWIINEALRKAKRLPKKKKGTNNGETDV